MRFREEDTVKRFQVEVKETGVTAVCELLEDQAPRTCAALWKVIKHGYEARAFHARWAGPEIVAFVPPEARAGVDPASIGIENATMYPARGDVTWMYFADGVYQMMPDEAWDLAFIYGDDCRFYIPAGMVTMNVWGKIVSGLDDFARESSQVYRGGAKTFRLSALP